MNTEGMHPNADEDPASIRQQAVNWLIRLDETPHDLELKASLNDWLNADPLHQQTFRQIKMIWLATCQTSHAPRRRPRIRPVLLIACLALALLFHQLHAPDYRSATGALRTVILNDGSKLILGADTAIDVDFNTTRRTVRLRQGSLYVEVGKSDYPRPFVVESPAGQAEALGTVFSAIWQTDQLLVSVHESTVQLTPSLQRDASQVLHEGENAIISALDVTRLPDTPQSRQPGWLDQQLVFTYAPLRQVLEQLQRHDSVLHWLQMPERHLLRTFTGVLDASNLEQAYTTLASSMDLEIDRSIPLLTRISKKE